MPIPVSCKCGQGFRAKDELAGKKVKCPKCGQILQIPGVNPSDSVASASGLLSIDDLMKLDASAPAGPVQGMPGQATQVPGMQIPGMQQGLPAQFPQGGHLQGGFAPPGAGGFQAPNPFFAQPGARPKSSGGNRGFMIAMASLGGVALLAIIGIVLIFVFRDGSGGNTTVATNSPLTVGPNVQSGGPQGTNPQTGMNQGGPNQGGPTQVGSTQVGSTQAGNQTGTASKASTPQTFVHPGFDTPEAAVDGFFHAIENEDVQTARDILRDMVGTAWEAIEKTIQQQAAMRNVSVDDLWREQLRAEKGKAARGGEARLLGEDRAFVPIKLTLPPELAAQIPTELQNQMGALCVRDANGRWHMGMEEQQRKFMLSAIQALGGGATAVTVTGPKLPAGLKQYYAQSKELRGAWLVEEDDQPHMGWGWMSELLPYIGHDELYKKLDFKKQYYMDDNRPLCNTIIPQFLNPADDRHTIKEFSPYRGMAVSHFAGMAGIEDHRQVVAAALPRSDPRAGVFGYDRLAKPSEITDGTSQTIMVLGVEMPRPWIQGGGATIRGAREPYFGGVTGSQFGTKGLNGTIALMADGSARMISASVDPAVFRAMCTIHGAEKVDLAPYPLKDDFFGTPAKIEPAKKP